MKPRGKQKRKQRNLHAIDAHFRNSAGPMKDNKKREVKAGMQKKS